MIYCLEDERNIRELIVYTLESSGFHAAGFSNSTDFFAAVTNEKPELILLDIMLPKESGLTVLQKLKDSMVTKDIPVIMVTARGSEFDKVTGLNMGADDYIAKPFGMMEFIARVRAVLRRGGIKESSNVLEYKSLVIHPEKHEVLADGTAVTLTLKEFELLKYLIENKDIVVTRNQILGHVWGYDFDGETRTVDVHIRTLRQKLGECGRYIETVRGVGYRIGG
ncbi:MAG: response regulator transcription factor [Frisingicoccus sp.]|uniref:response regulator transcription factor n=1 Tax=Frisingicoccus sp. TaxID=1918627 RepID=UPI002A8196BB|nr:response regulator transcription factor [Frisingicoccus sp.]MDY4835063.1 response regulator transcription factor [Frisingicoccus sp.]